MFSLYGVFYLDYFNILYAYHSHRSPLVFSMVSNQAYNAKRPLSGPSKPPLPNHVMFSIIHFYRR